MASQRSSLRGGPQLENVRRSVAPEFGGLSEIVLRSRLISLGFLGVPTFDVEIGVCRVEFDGSIVVSDEPVQITLVSFGGAPIGIGAGVFRVEF